MAKQVIIHVIDSLGIGGAERLLVATIKAMGRYNHVVCYLHPPETLAEDITGTIIYCLKCNSNSGLFAAAKQLRALIRLHQPFCVHAHLIRSCWVSRVAALGLCPLVFSIHSMLGDDAFKQQKLALWAERLTYSKKQTAIGVSAAVLHDYDDWVGLKGARFVLPNFVPDLFFKQQKSVCAHKAGFRLVAVGNLKSLKNYDRLLSAMALLKDAHISLDIWGDGAKRGELEQRIEIEQLPVRLCGVTNHIERKLPEYHALIMPSIHEGFGLAPAEAMATGLPVLLSDLAVFRELFGNYPVYFNPLEPASIAAAMRFAAGHMHELEQTAVAAKRFVQQQYSETGYRQKLYAIYQQIPDGLF